MHRLLLLKTGDSLIPGPRLKTIRNQISNRTTFIWQRVSIGCFILFLSSLVAAQAEPGKTFFSVRDFGAVGDGKNLDSPAINQAIDAAAKVGGGTVVVPAGTYLSGSIHLQNNIDLLIEGGIGVSSSQYHIVGWQRSNDQIRPTAWIQSNATGYCLTRESDDASVRP